MSFVFLFYLFITKTRSGSRFSAILSRADARRANLEDFVENAIEIFKKQNFLKSEIKKNCL